MMEKHQQSSLKTDENCEVESTVKTQNDCSGRKGKSKRFVCDLCNRDFPQKVCLQIHLRTHTGEKPWVCEICNRAFAEKRQLGRHWMIHTGEKPFKCNMCEKSFTQKGNLNDHLIAHSGERNFKCEECNASFSRKTALKSHILKHRGIVCKPYACTMCDKVYSVSSSLRQHLLTHTGEKPYVCDVCNKSFAWKESLQSHVLSHPGKSSSYECDLCSKKFIKRCDLRQHFLIHTREKPHVCALCNKSFTRYCDLKRHIFEHSGEKPFSCKVCDKKFSRQSHLKSHLLNHSRQSEGQKVNKERKFKCNLCDKAYYTVTGLKRHLVKHELKPYTCNVCKKMFSQDSDLQIHKMLHSGEKPYDCKICSKSFRRIDILKNHQLIHNRKINPYVCYNCKRKFIRQTNFVKHKCSLAKKRYGQQSIQKNVAVLPENTVKSTKIVDNEPLNCINEKETFGNVVCPNEIIDNMGAQNKIAFSVDNELIQDRREVTSSEVETLSRNSNTCSKNCTLTGKSLDIVEQNEITSEEVYVSNSVDCEITSACIEPKLAENNLNENVPPEMVSTDNQRNTVCNSCPKDFGTYSSLKQRVSTQPLEKHASHLCGGTLSQNCGFGNQIDQNIAPTSNVCECEVCHEEFSNANFLKTHFLTHSAEELAQVKKFVHLLPKNPSSVNKFKCDVCSRAFRDSCDIKRHLLLHTGVKPFVCEVCKKGYTRKDHLKRHHLKQHSNENLPPVRHASKAGFVNWLVD